MGGRIHFGGGSRHAVSGDLSMVQGFLYSCTLLGGDSGRARSAPSTAAALIGPVHICTATGHICTVTVTCLATSATALLAIEPIGCSAICQCGFGHRAEPRSAAWIRRAINESTSAPPCGCSHLRAAARTTQRPALPNIRRMTVSVTLAELQSLSPDIRLHGWIDGYTRLALVLVGLLDFVLLVTVIALAVARNEFASTDCVRILAISGSDTL